MGTTRNILAVTLACLLGISFCAGGYIWLQLRPQPSAEAPYEQPAPAEQLGPELVELDDVVGGVNFKKLQTKNPDMVGWVKIKGTNVDNVVVQSSDNDYYLHRSFTKKKYYPGTVFLDFRCDRFCTDYNTVLYGHHMADGSMFRDVARFIDPGYLKAHSKITYTDRTGVHKLKPFCVWAEHVNGNMNRVAFDSVEDFRASLKEMLAGKRLYNGADLDEIDHIWTFYTCSYQGDDFRTIVLAAEL